MKKFTLALATLALSVASMNAADYYLIGSFNKWTEADPAAHFTETAQTGVYELKYEGTLTSGFKVNDGTWTNPEINFGSNGSKSPRHRQGAWNQRRRGAPSSPSLWKNAPRGREA